jgi:hypothetical protein
VDKRVVRSVVASHILDFDAGKVMSGTTINFFNSFN